MGKRYRNVWEMVKDLSDEDFSNEYLVHAFWDFWADEGWTLAAVACHFDMDVVDAENLLRKIVREKRIRVAFLVRNRS